MKWTIAILLLIVISGCSLEMRIVRTQKFIEKYPETLLPYVDTVVKVEYDTVIRVDTFNRVFNVFIPGDTTYITTEVEHVYDETNLDEWGSPWHTETDTVHASAGFSEAISYVKDGTLHLELWQNPDTIRVSYDSLVVQKQYWERMYTEELLKIPVDKPVPWYYIAAAWTLVGEIVILILLFIISKILKRLKR